MRVVIGADHAGFLLKEELKKSLVAWGHQVEDVGTHSLESTDYPPFSFQVGERVAAANDTRTTLGLLVCGSGIGVSIAANKVHGARAARCEEPYSAKMSRQHNDANILCLGSRVVGVGLAEMTLQAFLEAAFEGGRHQRRIDQITARDA